MSVGKGKKLSHTSDTENSDDVVTKMRFLPREQEKPKEITLLENQFLQKELKKLKDEPLIDSLKQELEKELSKRIELEQKVIKLEVQDSPSQSSKPPFPQPTEKHKENFLNRLHDHFGVFMENFQKLSFHPKAIVEREDPLSPIKMTKNMRRLERDFRPVAHFFRNLKNMTFCFFCVYMCTVWYSWTIPSILLLMILHLSINYLTSKGWRIPRSIIPDVCEPGEHLKGNPNILQMFHLAFDSAQKTQKLFGNMADILEKIKNLCMWVRPELTVKSYVGLWLVFIFSCVFPYQLLGFIIGVSVAIKFFIIDLIFERCSKLQQWFDAPYNFWTNLPTDLQLRDTKRGAFHEAFNLPENGALTHISGRTLNKFRGRWGTLSLSRPCSMPPLSRRLIGAMATRLSVPVAVATL
uniref:GRAM domain-containing protein n=1 Tax=Xiphophorus maculatus TaxID=8083 RepID=A0A3B5R7B4_XIPMA